MSEKTRERAYLDGAIVTVLERHGRRKTSKVTIRDQFGYVRDVKSSDLDKPEKGSPEAVLHYEDNLD